MSAHVVANVLSTRIAFVPEIEQIFSRGNGAPFLALITVRMIREMISEQPRSESFDRNQISFFALLEKFYCFAHGRFLSISSSERLFLSIFVHFNELPALIFFCNYVFFILFNVLCCNDFSIIPFATFILLLFLFTLSFVIFILLFGPLLKRVTLKLTRASSIFCFCGSLWNCLLLKQWAKPIRFL